jgi:hypothetical protein
VFTKLLFRKGLHNPVVLLLRFTGATYQRVYMPNYFVSFFFACSSLCLLGLFVMYVYWSDRIPSCAEFELFLSVYSVRMSVYSYCSVAQSVMQPDLASTSVSRDLVRWSSCPLEHGAKNTNSSNICINRTSQTLSIHIQYINNKGTNNLHISFKETTINL